MSYTLFSWIYWDPSPELFLIPGTDHPIRWYGLFFAIGFALIYFIIQPIFRRHILNHSHIDFKHIFDWAFLLTLFRTASGDPSHPFHLIANKINRKALQNDAEEPSLEVKSLLLNALNSALRSASPEQRLAIEASLGKSVATSKIMSGYLTDRLCWCAIFAIIGARLGHVFFYAWPFYREHPIEIIKIWEGGLASHGGALGAMIALFFFIRTIRPIAPWLNYICLLDCLVIPTSLAGCLIRMGNFFNQEIIGIPSTLPWAIIFGHPFEDPLVVPRHATQLYEAGFYFLLFIFLFSLWYRTKDRLKEGYLSGLFFVLMFSFRFFIEFLKVSGDSGSIGTGQWLSIPFVLLGIFLLIRSKSKSFRVAVSEAT